VEAQGATVQTASAERSGPTSLLPKVETSLGWDTWA